MREALSGGGMSVTEAAGADQPIGRLPTSTTGFVGRALRGPVNRATRVRSFAEYQQIFGGLWQPSMLAYAVEQYFDSGGREAVVVRVINGGAPATITLPCGKESLQLEAVSPGSRETLRASVDYDNIGSNEDDRFNLVLQRVRTLGSEHIEDQEIFRRLSIEPGTTRFVVRALQESMLVRVRGAVPSVRPDRTFRAGARHPIGYVDSNPDGDDGVPLTDYDLIGSPDRGHRACSPCATSRTCISSAFRRPRATATSGRACCSSQRSSVVSAARCSSSIRPATGKPATKHCAGCAGSRSKVKMP